MCECKGLMVCSWAILLQRGARLLVFKFINEYELCLPPLKLSLVLLMCHLSCMVYICRLALLTSVSSVGHQGSNTNTEHHQACAQTIQCGIVVFGIQTKPLSNKMSSKHFLQVTDDAGRRDYYIDLFLYFYMKIAIQLPCASMGYRRPLYKCRPNTIYLTSD